MATDMDAQIAQLIDWYGETGGATTREQWRRILTRDPAQPLTLINFFKLRERAVYPASSPLHDQPGSGGEAFARYGAVSMPGLERVGGRFLLVAPFAGVFMGEEEAWDMVAIGSYPDARALLALLEDAAYREAFAHRLAACERQNVYICAG